LTEPRFTYAFANTFPPDDARRAYERFAVPDSGQLLHEGAFANLHRHAATKVDFRNDARAPLLITAGSRDHTVPARVAKANYRKYKARGVRTDFVEFPNRSHLLMVERGWEFVASRIADWLDDVLVAGDDGVAPPTQEMLVS